jgi:hypothetical protein
MLCMHCQEGLEHARRLGHAGEVLCKKCAECCAQWQLLMAGAGGTM